MAGEGSSRKAGLRTVLLHIEASQDYQRRLIEGITRFARRRQPDWDFVFSLWPSTDADPGMLMTVPAAGILAECRDIRPDEVRKPLLERGIPVVGIGLPVEAVPTVVSDDFRIAEVALAHLRSKGFKRFAFFQEHTNSPFRERREAFRRLVGDADAEFVPQPLNLVGRAVMDAEHRAALQQWVRDLPKPIGLFSGNVQAGLRLLIACKDTGVRVPEEIAVLGCDHDELFCELTSPPLSTIDHGMERVGYEAANLLNRLMLGADPPEGPLLVDPVGVVERQSTDTLAIEDEDVREAVRFIQEHALEGIGPRDVLAHVPVARRKLEIAFREQLDRTIAQQIVHHRVEHAKHLLINTNMAMPDIAAACSFSYATRLHEAFKRVTGMAPGTYRRAYQID